MAPPEFVSTAACPLVPASKERPMLFSAPMVRALLDGTKTQTRRVVKPQPIGLTSDGVPFVHTADDERFGRLGKVVVCPYGNPGDRLWVREAWATHAFLNDVPPRLLEVASVHYAADGQIQTGKGRPSIHMPRKYSRIDLEITGVRVERLQDISEADADAEGCERLDNERDVRDWKLCHQCGGTRLYTAYAGGGACPDTDCQECDTYVKRYRHLWEAINGPGCWEANPWVWAVEFRRIRP